MNVYQKLQKCRVALHKAGVKQSGRNTHAGYQYYELGDFLPKVNELFAEHGLFGHVTFDTEFATLTIINAEKPDEQVVFTSPMESASLRGVQPIQNVGAVQTYQRRYLYLMALEISEGDALDAMHNPDDRAQSQRPAAVPSAPPRQSDNGATSNGGAWQMSDAQRKRLFAIARGAGVDADGVRSLVQSVSGQESTAALTREQYDTICEMLQAQGQASA